MEYIAVNRHGFIPQALEPSDKYLITPLNSTHYTLTITNFNEDDAGHYSCDASNDQSHDAQILVLNVESKFSILVILQQFVARGRNVP